MIDVFRASNHHELPELPSSPDQLHQAMAELTE